MEKRDNNDAQQTILGVVALVVSAIALVGTVLQVAQQYYSSAAGYTECGESVMGPWHTSKRRKFRLYELRFEVQFETPVIFVCPATNTKGPVRDVPISFLDGTDESLEKTRTLLPTQDRKHRDELVSRAKQVHTADNERATWVMMLSELQSMERDSLGWQETQYKEEGPSNKYDKQVKFGDYGLAVAIQPKKRSWDTMPSTVKKPYATTAMCHLLEIAAMLGLHWKEFNRSTDRYRAEGNGYILTGTKVDDLGLMFTFQIYGKSRFQVNRVIPVDEVKELCCGYISTFFRKGADARRLELTDDGPQDLTFLQVGSANDLAEAMVLIGCNTNTANYFRSDKTKHGHLFPVAFELVGMLAKCLHMKNSCFRMLPNPTPYHWDKKFFSLRKLLQEYKKKVEDEDYVPDQTPQVQYLTRLAAQVVAELRPAPQDFSIPLLDALHDAIDHCDKFLTEHISLDLITMVLREHFQEILRMVNEDPADATGGGSNSTANAMDDGQAPASATSPTGGTATAPSATPKGTPRAGSEKEKLRPPRFDDLNAASPEEKQAKFMNIYFEVVLPRVKKQAVGAFERRKTTHYAPSHHGRDPSVGSVHSTGVTPSQSPEPRPGLKETQSHRSSHMLQPGLHIQINEYELSHIENKDGGVHSFHQALKYPTTDDLVKQATDIWCTLVFRMLCWLLLHDFHKKDVQISKSELLGSRLPVYIA